MAPTAAGMSSRTAAMRMSLRIFTMALANFSFISSHLSFRRKQLFSVFPTTPYYSTLTRGVKRQPFPSVIADVMPLPLGEVSPEVTERASHRGKNLCAAISCVFVRARSSLRLPFFDQRPCPLRRFAPALPKGELGAKQKAGRTGGQVCVSRILYLFCTERRTRAPRAARRESGANHKPLSPKLLL